MSADGLVAQAQSSTTLTSGTFAVYDIDTTARALLRGDWVEAGVMGMVGGLDALSFAADPLAGGVAVAVGWALEHIGPLRRWLDDLAGDPDQIHAFASTWHRIAGRLHETGDEFLAEVGRATSRWDGLAIDAYRGVAAAEAGTIDGFAAMCTAVAGVVETAGVIVAGVRGMVRDAIANLVGLAISIGPEVATGFLAPHAIARFTAKVASTVSHVSRFIHDLVSSMHNLGRLLEHLLGGIEQTARAIKPRLEWWSTPTMNKTEVVDLLGVLGPRAHLQNLGGNGGSDLTGLDDRPDVVPRR